jgi:hypothetical protein
VNTPQGSPAELQSKRLLFRGLRLLLGAAAAVTCLLTFIPGGHSALPLGIGFLRFVNPTASLSAADWTVLAVYCGGLFATALGIALLRWWPVALAISLYGLTIGLAFAYWADPPDGAMLVTAAPFVLVSAGLVVACVRARIPKRHE